MLPRAKDARGAEVVFQSVAALAAFARGKLGVFSNPPIPDRLTTNAFAYRLRFEIASDPVAAWLAAQGPSRVLAARNSGG
jgi:hypothetical protein